MVERPPDLEVHVVAVRNGGVTARGAVALRAIERRADRRASRRQLEAVLVDVSGVRGVKMPVVEEIHVVAVPHGPMAAVRPVPVLVGSVTGAAAVPHAIPMLPPSGP